MHGELVHGAGDRRPDLELLQLVPGGDLAFGQFVDARAGLGEVARCLAAHVLVDLQDLQLGLRDLGADLRGGGDQLAELAVELGDTAFGIAHAVVGHEILRLQRAQPFDLVMGQVDLAPDRVFLRLDADELLLELRDLLPELGLLAIAPGT